MATPLWAMGLVVFGTMIGSFASLLMKMGSEEFSIRKPWLLFKNFKLMCSLAISGVSSIIFIFALRAGELSVLYPIVAVNYIWIAILSVYFLKEKMNWYKWLGIGLIILGVALIGIASSDNLLARIMTNCWNDVGCCIHVCP